jgi:carbonic anhydrase
LGGIAFRDPDEALTALVEGNRRWMESNPLRPNQSPDRRASLAEAQSPFAQIFCCVDSRVPPELIFDRGIGDLLVTRTAGHVLDRAVLGSLEFGVEVLHIPLLLVLGHQGCGAVGASIAAVDHRAEPPGAIGALVDSIRPAIDRAGGRAGDAADNVVRANVELTVASLKATHPILYERVESGAVKIVGGRYDLETGAVDLIA